jgi:hypothetical protein
MPNAFFQIDARRILFRIISSHPVFHASPPVFPTRIKREDILWISSSSYESGDLDSDLLVFLKVASYAN